MSGLTKGPWFLFSDESGMGHTNIVSLTERTTCVASFPGRHKTEPDLVLMAAAPELLEALKDVVSRCRCSGTGMYSYNPDIVPVRDCGECDTYRAAIAKAEGK